MKVGEITLRNFSLLLFLFCSYSYGQVVDDISTSVKVERKNEISEVTKSNLLTELTSLHNKKLSEVELEIQNFNKKVLYYVQTRDKECKGEFSSIELNEDGESKVVKRKLSKTEKKLCLIDLVNFRKTYINQVFEIRKKILINNHNKQVDELESIRKESIKKMDDLVSDLTK